MAAHVADDDATDDYATDYQRHGRPNPGRGRLRLSPRTILESMLFVGHPGNEALTAAQVAGLIRGVRPGESTIWSAI